MRTLTALALLLAAHAATAAPAAGTYDARLCVTVASQEPTCGPAQARLAGNRLQVQVSDIVYRLQLKSSQAEVALMHGNMQIDEFTGSFDWVGSALHFSDPTKKASYEVVLGERKLAPK